MATEDPYNEFWDIVHSAPDYDYDEQAEAVHAASDLVELPDGWELRLTCGACPEQYELYDKHQRIAGYFRLRYGSFYVAFPDVGGEVVYQHEYHGDPLLGVFPDQEHRVFHLQRGVDAVRARKSSDHLTGWTPHSLQGHMLTDHSNHGPLDCTLDELDELHRRFHEEGDTHGGMGL